VIKNSFGNKWTNDALCFMLDATHGHIVGKVMRQSRRQSGINTYDIAWECTALGETQVNYSFIRDACIAGCGLVTLRTERPIIQSSKRRRGRPHGTSQRNRLDAILSSLRNMSDDDNSFGCALSSVLDISACNDEQGH
jgi:hypothetical protein